MSQPKLGVGIGVAVCLAVIWCVPSIPSLADDPQSTAQTGSEKRGTDDTESGAEDGASAARQEAIPVFNEGVAALEAEDLPTALVCFSRASEIDPEYPEAWNATAAIALELKKYQIAADAAEELLRLQPDNTSAMGTAYFSELMMSDTDRLIPSARRLAVASPEMVSNEMMQHTQILFDTNDLVGSRGLLEIILEREPELAPAHFQLGLTCNRQEDVKCAKEAFEKFLELAPEDPDAATAQSLLDYLNAQP